MRSLDDVNVTSPAAEGKRMMTDQPNAMHDDETPLEHKPSADDDRLVVVGIGASAGGLLALRTFFGALPDGHGMAFVVIMHLDPERESSLAELLQPLTAMTVEQVTGQVQLEPEHVYVIPPNRRLSISDEHLTLADFEHPRGQRVPIDIFFRSLATREERGIAIVLSGSGTDGTVGVREVKEHGGLVLVQDPAEADYDSMPRSAIQAGVVDAVLPAAELGKQLVAYHERLGQMLAPHTPGDLPDDGRHALNEIVAQLHSRTGHDFSHYKRSTLLRRIGRRMQMKGVATPGEYLEIVRSDGDEAARLFKDLLISVTQFFRDPPAWEALEREAIPELLESRGPDEQVRVWVPGCATGEEAYSLAIALLDHAATLSHPPEIQIFASDIDEQAIAFARQGIYPEAIAADVPPDRLGRYFTPDGDHYRVNKVVREHLLFAVHSLLKHPPFSRMDLISCRNLLIYIERSFQRDILHLFHYALRPNGYLFLGTAESADAISDLFVPVVRKHRIYRRHGQPTGPPSVPYLDTGLSLDERLQRPALRADGERESRLEQHERLLEQHAPPSVVVDRDHTLVHLSASAGRFFERPAGEPSNDLVREIRPELRPALHEMLDAAFETGRAANRGPIQVELDGTETFVYLIVQLATDARDASGDHALVLFVESDEQSWGGDVLPSVDEEPTPRLQQLRDEVQRLRERLQTTSEQYESSREEMKAANEELQSINEEYKSTAEELETSKEELQSVNEELETVNQELKHKVEALSQANSDLQNLMDATEIGTIFLNGQLRIQRYTPRITELFNIMPSDRGRPIEHLTYTVDYDRLVPDAKEVLRELKTIEREVAGAGEDWYLVRMRPYRTVEDVIDGVVITFVDITQRKQAEEELQALTDSLEERVQERTAQLRRTRDMFHTLFHASPVPMLITRPDMSRVVNANEAYLTFFDHDRDALADTAGSLEMYWPDPDQRREVIELLADGGRVSSAEVILTTATGETRTALVFAERIEIDEAPHELWVFIDITARKEAEEKIRSLASAITIAEQKERQRVAHVLHDELQQLLYGVRYTLTDVRGQLEDSETDVPRDALDEAEGWLERAIHETRHLTVSLSPPVLEGEGLAEALHWLAAQMEEMHGLEVSVESDEEHKVRDPDKRILLFQTTRELLFNVVKHAATKRVDVRLTESDGYWHIEVVDDGVGFDPTEVGASAERATGFGLARLAERIRLFDGALEVEASVGEGTRIVVRLPLPDDAEEAPA